MLLLAPDFVGASTTTSFKSPQFVLNQRGLKGGLMEYKYGVRSKVAAVNRGRDDAPPSPAPHFLRRIV
ncbi:hypothetical protein EVAR_100715_1 [Eumeta japonica]|uniref:Uncharacterized protein n=1 Tax=Eumeta variegata TaxID=151549 RepID=A0A4C2A0N5_EUMVA|nr:hypothetical protein EVAR_100715_1 [Eumeta japonica]